MMAHAGCRGLCRLLLLKCRMRNQKCMCASRTACSLLKVTLQDKVYHSPICCDKLLLLQEPFHTCNQHAGRELEAASHKRVCIHIQSASCHACSMDVQAIGCMSISLQHISVPCSKLLDECASNTGAWYLPGLAIAMPHSAHDGVHHCTGQVQQPKMVCLHKAVCKCHPLSSTPATVKPLESIFVVHSCPHA